MLHITCMCFGDTLVAFKPDGTREYVSVAKTGRRVDTDDKDIQVSPVPEQNADH